jgi:hypothetical protein
MKTSRPYQRVFIYIFLDTSHAHALARRNIAMASTLLTIVAVHGFRTTISALTSAQTSTTTTSRPKYAFIRSKKILKFATAANREFAEKVRFGRPEVYRLVEFGRKERPKSELGAGENTIDVWRRVEDGYEDEEGKVKERWAMKMSLDRGLRQTVRDLRQSGSGQNEDKESREKKKKVKKDMTSARTARKPERRDTTMSDREDERQQRGRSDTQSSTLSTASMQAFTTHVTTHQYQRPSAKDLLKSPNTTQTLTPNTMQTPYASKSQRRKPRPSFSSPPFGQPTMSPEQSANFVFGKPNPNTATSLQTGINGCTILTVPQDGEPEMFHQEAKKRSPGIQFVAEQVSAFTIKSKPKMMTQIPGSLERKSSRYEVSTPSVEANGKKWIQEEEERVALLEMDEEEEE